MNNLYDVWMRKVTTIPYLYEELQEIGNNKKEITDRFWRDLEFGTGGLRGLIGAGTNRMNIFTVGKASQGLATYLLENFDTPSIAIAYDTRNFSKEFAQYAGQVFCANNIQTYLYEDVRPTPMLSFAVRHLTVSAGIVITASHNPKEYNGYKVYGYDGGQITDKVASSILEKINQCDIFEDVKLLSWKDALSSPNFHFIGEDVDVFYYQNVKNLVLRKNIIKDVAQDLHILYSPLHGSGNIPVRRVLSELGFSNLDIVKEQELPDGNFPTTPYPNPEEPAVYNLAINQAQKSNPDLIFATDPDCDRIGILVKDSSGDFTVLTGNQVGALLSNYIIQTHLDLGTLPSNPAIIKTIVTSDMGKAVCEKNGVEIFETLTGFKYIGELVGQWEKDHSHSFLLGFEESYGYLSGDFVRDKDAVIASILISEMALWYKTQELSLFQAINTLYEEYGYFSDKLISITKSGQEGQSEITEILSNLRTNYETIFSKDSLTIFEDYKSSIKINLVSREKETLCLPSSNVLKFIFEDGSWIVLRPSGTEPKIKVYLASIGYTKEMTEARMSELENLISSTL